MNIFFFAFLAAMLNIGAGAVAQQHFWLGYILLAIGFAMLIIALPGESPTYDAR